MKTNKDKRFYYYLMESKDRKNNTMGTASRSCFFIGVDNHMEFLQELYYFSCEDSDSLMWGREMDINKVHSPFKVADYYVVVTISPVFILLQSG
jgi:hypothetical protein